MHSRESVDFLAAILHCLPSCMLVIFPLRLRSLHFGMFHVWLLALNVKSEFTWKELDAHRFNRALFLARDRSFSLLLGHWVTPFEVDSFDGGVRSVVIDVCLS